MSKLQYSTIVAMVQDNVDDDIYDFLDDGGEIDDVKGLAIANPIAFHLLSKLYETYDADATDSEKLDTFAGIITEIRDTLDLIEQSIENWEEYIDSGNND